MKSGTKVRVLSMNDPYPVPPGTVGIVEGTDALGDYLVTWSNGSTLKLIPEADQWEVIDETDALFSTLPVPSHRRSGGN